MMLNGKQYAVVIFKTANYVPCFVGPCPFFNSGSCTAPLDNGCIVHGQRRGVNYNKVSFVELGE